MSTNLAEIRNEYKYQQLTENIVNHNPFLQLKSWLDEAIVSKVHEPTAMNIATVGRDNRPSSRIVLLKELSQNGLVFFTNYESKKGKELFHPIRVAVTGAVSGPELEKLIPVLKLQLEKIFDHFNNNTRSDFGTLQKFMEQMSAKAVRNIFFISLH